MGTRDRILCAARRCFARQGFHGTSVERILDEAGISKGAFYWHFPSKFDLYRIVMEAEAEALNFFFEPVDEEAGEDPVTFITRKGRQQLENFSDDPDLTCLWKSLHVEGMRGNEPFRNLSLDIWKRSMDYLTVRFLDAFPAFSSGSEEVDAGEVLESLSACFQGLVFQMGIVRDLEKSKTLWSFTVHRVLQGGKCFKTR